MNDSEQQNLQGQIDDLKGRIARVYESVSRLSRPLHRVFLAKENGEAGTWKEVTVNQDGEIEDYAHGRTGTVDEFSEMLDFATVEGGGDCYAAIAVDSVADGLLVKRYMKIGGDGDVLVVDLLRDNTEDPVTGYDGFRSPPTWTYTATRGGVTLGDGLAPFYRPLDNGNVYTPATKGLGHMSSGTFVLLIAFETYTTSTHCEA